ncbi:hypothetical protein BDR26DRAFT_868912 [Obelidium mucronatum]|nr:hypothetical protein BDR26DRAFT_868912 [Obelidium mucronatum]
MIPHFKGPGGESSRTTVSDDLNQVSSEIAKASLLICPWEGCQKEFSDAANLKSHYFLHSNIKPYRCNECSSDFVRRRDMVRHQRTVHKSVMVGTPIHKCGVCGITFSRKDSLARHSKDSCIGVWVIESCGQYSSAKAASRKVSTT